MAAKSGGGTAGGSNAPAAAANEAEAGPAAPIVDQRLEFLSHVIQKSLRLKPDRWVKVLSVEEYRKMIMEFLDHAEPPLIIFTQSGPGILAVCNAPLNSPGHPALTVVTKLKLANFIKICINMYVLFCLTVVEWRR